jgi:site-specific recombinase XerD
MAVRQQSQLVDSTSPATTIRQPAAELPAEVASFIRDLERQETATKTRVNYASDLRHCAAWFQRMLGEEFRAQAVTPTDIRDYRSYLMTVERRKPATVNRRLAALRRFFGWARGLS